MNIPDLLSRNMECIHQGSGPLGSGPTVPGSSFSVMPKAGYAVSYTIIHNAYDY